MKKFTDTGWQAPFQLVLLAGSLGLVPQLAAAQSATAAWQWATRAIGSAASSNDFSEGNYIRVDGAGNSFSAGSFHGTLTLGSTALASPGGYDSFLAKYTPTGALAWVRHLNGTSQETVAYGLAIDAGGNSYVSGYYYGGTLTVGSVTLTGGGGFVVKYDPQGTVLWARQAGHVVNGIACTAAGELVALGGFDGTVLFGSTTLTSPAMASSNFLVKYDTQGNPIWARQLDGASNDEGYVGLDGAGNIYLAADFRGTATLGAITLPGTASDEDVVVAKYSAAGVPLWALRQPVAGPPGTEHAWGLATDATGNTYLTGSSQVAGASDQQWFVTKYTPQGTIGWNHLSTAVSENSALIGVAADAAGNVYVSGGIAGSLRIGGLTLGSPGAATIDLALLSFTPLGQPRWAITTGTAGAEAALGLALDASNALYLTGALEGNAALGSLAVPQNSASVEQFVAKLTVSSVTAARAARALEQVPLFPNPAHGGTVALRWPPLTAAPGKLLVHDALGRCMLTLPLPAGQPEILLPVQSLKPGMYTVQLETAGAVAAGHLVLE